MSRPSPKPHPRRIGRRLLWLGCAAFLAACGSRLTPAPGSGAGGEAPALPSGAAADATEVSGGSGPAAGVPAGGLPAAGEAGEGVVLGRLIDGVTGQALKDAGLSLSELGRRTISAPGGFFRFDGVAPGSYTLVVGPAEGYVPHSRPLRVTSSGLDAGLIALLPAEPPVLIVPDYGGKVAACGATALHFPADSLVEALPIQVTCLDGAEALPAPAPAGRLPLAVVDSAPGDLALSKSARITVQLPAQPRYAPGVVLDLLRLDLNRLVWTPTASLVVDEGGRSASGQLLSLGTFMAAAPPYGAFAGDDERPQLTRLNTSDARAGGPVDVFPAETPLVYLSLDYSGMADTRVRTRTVNQDGAIIHEDETRYEGKGRDNLPMAPERGTWPVGRYMTTVYFGQPPQVASVDWRVAAEPTPAPAPPTLPPVAPLPRAASLAFAPAALPAGAAGCRTPATWYAYRIQAGDTLYGLARSTGVDAGTLAEANCLADLRLAAGALLYLPDIPRAPQPGLPAWPSYPKVPPTWPGYPKPPVAPTYAPRYPTQAAPSAGPTPPPYPPTPFGAPPIEGTVGPPIYPPTGPGAAQPPAGGDPTLKGLRGPDPTLAPRPLYPPVNPPVNPPAGPPPGAQPALPPALPPAAGPRSLPAQPPVAPPAAPPSGGGNKGPRGPEPTLAPRPIYPPVQPPAP